MRGSDGRAHSVPTVLWLANLEVPDQWKKGGEKNRSEVTGCHTVWSPAAVFELWEKFHVVVIFILK